MRLLPRCLFIWQLPLILEAEETVGEEGEIDAN